MKTHKTKSKKYKKTYRDWTIYLYFREILNYFYIRKIIKKEKNTETWNVLNLRSDWVGRIYTVINLRKEDLGEQDEVKRFRLGEMMKPINSYLRSLYLHEIIYPAIEQLSEQSYLIVYSPLFNKFTLLRTIKYIIVITVIILGIIFGLQHGLNIF